MPYQYLNDVYRYRDTETGRFVSQRTIDSYVRRSIESSTAATADLSKAAANLEIDGATFRLQAREQIKREYMRAYMLGRGGRNNMTSKDWGIVGQQLRQQYAYLDRFVADIGKGRYDENPNGIQNRLAMYMNSARQAYSRAELEVRGIPALPMMPGQGKTQCLTNCKCTLQMKKEGKLWHIFWKLGKAEHCPDCDNLSRLWNPLIYDIVAGAFLNMSLNDAPPFVIKESWLGDMQILNEFLSLAEDCELLDFEIPAHWFDTGESHDHAEDLHHTPN
jgi:hypothetical protein